jgi:hypothetical protein
MVLKIPPDVADRIPFELEPAIRSAWLIGLIPALAGLGRIIGGLLTRPWQREDIATRQISQPTISTEPPPLSPLGSVTEHTTELLETSEPKVTARDAARQ